MDLFSIQEDAGGGLVFWHPKGAVIRRIIEDYWKNMHIQHGYQLVHTPHIANLNLWKTSGHVDFYRKDMFQTVSVDNEEYQLKPMNCPFHCILYKDTSKSYRDLPLRWGELGTVYRYERSGTLHGLFRVRGFTQDDAHLFCLPTQLQTEITGVLTLIEKILTRFGFSSFQIVLSTRPEESVGSDEIWEKATSALKGALGNKKWLYEIDEGGGAFYGPKIDIKIRDAIGRNWQCSTVQCDFNLPERFDLEYISNDNMKQRPIMVHRAIFGSLERFFGILIEETAGEFPLWLAPIQIRLLPVVDGVRSYCDMISEQALSLGIRAEVDSTGNRLSKQVRNAEQEKLPLIAVIGAQEMQEHTITLRSKRRGGDLGTMSWGVALKVIQAAANEGSEVTKEMIEEFRAKL
jgi:threonyl-tRNA synthetase